tara:strand:- start:3 stop:161 length:159 start_codon:yes stop_codon:yes gene_type:complete
LKTPSRRQIHEFTEGEKEASPQQAFFAAIFKTSVKLKVKTKHNHKINHYFFL